MIETIDRTIAKVLTVDLLTVFALITSVVSNDTVVKSVSLCGGVALVVYTVLNSYKVFLDIQAKRRDAKGKSTKRKA